MSATTALGVVPAGAARARRQATAVAAFGAVVPTILAAQGMAAVAVDVLGFSVVAAVALAGFLELALVSSALLARAAALAGRAGGADSVAVWVVSALSGLLSGLHELIDTTAAGPSTWTTDPGDVLAASVRVVAPLVAAWLWERVLQAARAEQAERTLAEIRRDRRLLDVGRAALAVRRLGDVEPGRTPTGRHRRAWRRLDRTYLSALRVLPPATDLGEVLVAVGRVDTLAAATVVPAAGRRPDSGAVGRAIRDRPAVAAAHRPFTAAAHVTAPATPVDTAQSCALSAERSHGSANEALDLAIELVRADPEMSGSRLTEELAHRGHAVSERTGRRLRGRALAAIAGEVAHVRP